MQNYYGFKGVRINQNRFSSHHFEEEVLLMEGIKMFVVSVEEQVVLNSEIESLKKYNEKKITVINLFNSD